MRGEKAGSQGSGRKSPRAANSRKDTGNGDGRSTDAALADFARSRQGVEGYIEPPTRLYRASLLLVADNGEHLRRTVPSPAAARELCQQLGLPVYDARKVGYPRRMHDFVEGRDAGGVDVSELPPWPADDSDTHDPRRRPGSGDE